MFGGEGNSVRQWGWGVRNRRKICDGNYEQPPVTEKRIFKSVPHFQKNVLQQSVRDSLSLFNILLLPVEKREK